jgi:LysM repeat protein
MAVLKCIVKVLLRHGKRTSCLAMSGRGSLFLLVVLAVSSVPQTWAGELFLYLPNSVAASAPYPENAVLVRKITINPGETLSRIAKRYSGKGYYYPQILLFNKIADPNRIYAGTALLVPVRSAQIPSGVSRPVASSSVESGRRRSTARSIETTVVPITAAASASTNERRLFDESVTLFTRGNFREALAGFSYFLQSYPNSPLAADASLYRADCYLGLSRN